MRSLAALVALLVVLAGCGASTPVSGPASAGPLQSDPGIASATGSRGDATETPTPEPSSSPAGRPAPTVTPRELAASYDIETVDGELPVDVELVYARVAVLLNRTSVAPPERVDVEPNARMGVGASRYPEFYRLLGIRVPEGKDTALTAAAYVASPETVTVNRRLLRDPNGTERTLAHESVHVVQFRTNAFRRTAEGVTDGRTTTDDSLVRRSVTEGGATYTTTVYAERYGEADVDPTRRMARRYRNATGAAKLGLAPYYFGARYVDQRIDSPASLREIYRRPPHTSEELIHGLAPGAEPVVDTAVIDAADGDGWEVVPTTRDTFGELFLRVVLGGELNESTAGAGADGWAGDHRVAFRNTGSEDHGRGYAWAITFDDAANATEFEAVFGEWREARERAGTRPIRTTRVTDRTVVVFLGDESFVSAATATGEDGRVDVRVG